MPGAQTIAPYKIKQAYTEASLNKANPEKEHFLLTYSFNGKNGSRILRDATDAFGTKKYYDYTLKKELTLEQLKKSMGITDVEIGSVGTLSRLVPDRPVIKIKVNEMPVPKTASEMAQESAPAVFDYYRMINRIMKKNVNYCADFAAHVFALVALENGKTGTIVSCNAWEMDKYQDKLKFSKTYLVGLDQNALRKNLISAPAGTIITLRSHSQFANTLDEGLPSHAMISLGNGTYVQNINNKILFVDMNNASIRTDTQTGKISLDGFEIVEKSEMYEPDFRKFPTATEVAVKASDIGMSGNITPSKFAEAVSEKFGIPKTFVISQILMQTDIKVSELGYVKNDLEVKLNLPAYLVQEYMPQFKVTPAIASLQPQRKIQEAGFLMFRSDNDKKNETAALYRRDKYNEQIQSLHSFVTKLGIPEGTFNNLMAILYNENYSSKRNIDRRKLGESLFIGTFGVNLSPRRRINSVGDFQINIDAVCTMLSKNERMDEFRAAMEKMGINDKKLNAKLDGWSGLDQKEKRKLVTDEILSRGAASLYFAHKFYKNNAAVLQETAFKLFGTDLPVGGTELSAFFAHNRGIPKTIVAIFQQNLMIDAEKARIKYSGFKIDGIIGMETVELYKKVCEYYGIKETTYREGTISTARLEKENTIDIAAFQKIFKSYSNMETFFNVYLKSDSAKAVLDPAFLREHPDNLSPYMNNYFVFFNKNETRVCAPKQM